MQCSARNICSVKTGHYEWPFADRQLWISPAVQLSSAIRPSFGRSRLNLVSEGIGMAA
jgi:hypothetical protein